MESVAQVGSILLMGVFAVGVIGCAITIPICAAKFFAILFERSEEPPLVAVYASTPVYQSAEPPPASSPVAADKPAPPRARGAAAGR